MSLTVSVSALSTKIPQHSKVSGYNVIFFIPGFYDSGKQSLSRLFENKRVLKYKQANQKLTNECEKLKERNKILEKALKAFFEEAWVLLKGKEILFGRLIITGLIIL